MPDPTPDAAAATLPRGWLPLAVLVSGLLLTAALGAWALATRQAERHALLERRAEAFGLALSGRVQSYVDTLPGLRVFGVFDKAPTDEEFLHYVGAISLQQRFPGLAVTFLAQYVEAERRDGFVESVRRDRSYSAGGHPAFDIRPAGERPHYMVLRHLYPEDPPAFGYDLYDPAQSYRVAVDAAVSSGGYVATSPILLARDRFKPEQPQLTSVVVRAAFYAGGLVPATPEARREQLQGVVGIAFRTAELVQSVLPADLSASAHVRVTDVLAEREGRRALIFDSDLTPAAASPGPVGGAPLRLRIDVADRAWEIAVTERPPPLAALLDSTTLLLLLFGAALSLSLAVMTRALVQGKVLAERRTRRATAALLAEKANLEQSEGRYRMLFEHSLDAVLRTRPDGEVLAANPAACALFGRSEAALQALGRAGLVDTTDPRLHVLVEQRARTGHAQGQFRMVRADGSLFEAEVASNTYIDNDGRAVASVIVRDVTEKQRQAREQARLTAILDATTDFVGSVDPEGRNMFLNRAARAMLGRSEHEDLGALRIADCHPAWASRLLDEVGLPAARRDGVWSGQTAILAADGREIPVSQLVLCHRDAAGEITHLSTVARDLTDVRRAEAERQALEARLRESQKMESIGTLAGGVAHDFNNVLAAILGNVALAREDLGGEHPTQPHLARIQQAAVRARALVQQILTFSRRTPQERTEQPLGPLVAESLALLRSTLPATVSLRAALAETPLHACVDAAQVQQVVMNLCTNAWQALPDQHGHVAVSLEAVDLVPGLPAPDGLAPGAYARLRVRDDGCGIDDATRTRIFEPFFTTKPVGQGTGLGLAVVHGIVVASGGGITVDSAPGAGTCFDVYLPRAEADGPGARTTEPTVGSREGRGEQILYVDDDEVVALTIQSLLERAGYRVTRRATGQEALDAVTREPGRYALVVTDYNMPGMSGLGVAETLGQLAPGLPVVITSGYVTEDMRQRAQALGVRAVLLKEHSLERLGALVHQLLRPA